MEIEKFWEKCLDEPKINDLYVECNCNQNKMVTIV